MKKIESMNDEALWAEIKAGIKDDDIHLLRKKLKKIVNPPPKRDLKSSSDK